MASKRERTIQEMAALSRQVLELWHHAPKELVDEVFPFDLSQAKTYWSQSKIDSTVRKLKAILLQAKAARYDLIAPQYDQMCIDMAEPLVEDPEYECEDDCDNSELPF